MYEFMFYFWGISLPIATIVLYVLLVKKAYTKGSRRFLVAASSLPPIVSTYSLLSWCVGFMGYFFLQEKTSLQTILLYFASGTYWREPLYWIMDILRIQNSGLPWTWGGGGSSYFGCFPSEASFKYFASGFINDTSVVWLIAVFCVWIIGVWSEKMRKGD